MTCSVDGCSKPVQSAGLCTTHYQRQRRYGTTDLIERPPITHCKRGHEFTPENTYVKPTNGARMCRECMRMRRHEQRRIEREADRAWFASLGAD